jgi:hypothetical protein
MLVAGIVVLFIGIIAVAGEASNVSACSSDAGQFGQVFSPALQQQCQTDHGIEDVGGIFFLVGLVLAVVGAAISGDDLPKPSPPQFVYLQTQPVPMTPPPPPPPLPIPLPPPPPSHTRICLGCGVVLSNPAPKFCLHCGRQIPGLTRDSQAIPHYARPILLELLGVARGAQSALFTLNLT